MGMWYVMLSVELVYYVTYGIFALAFVRGSLFYYCVEIRWTKPKPKHDRLCFFNYYCSRMHDHSGITTPKQMCLIARFTREYTRRKCQFMVYRCVTKVCVGSLVVGCVISSLKLN